MQFILQCKINSFNKDCSLLNDGCPVGPQNFLETQKFIWEQPNVFLYADGAFDNIFAGKDLKTLNGRDC